MPLPPMPGPGLGPLLSDHVLAEAIERGHELANSIRKARAAERQDILDEDFHHLVVAKIEDLQKDKRIARRMVPHVSVLLNPASDITTQAACVYKRGARRNLIDAHEDEAKVWAGLHRGIDLQMPTVNRTAFFVGPTAVVPELRGNRVVRTVLKPHQYDVVLDRSDSSTVAALVWEVERGTNLAESDPQTVRWIVLDREAWRYFNFQWVPVKGPEGHEVVEHGIHDEHGAPTVPFAVFRTSPAVAPDWWGSSQNQRLAEATIDACYVWARMQFVRKSQDANLIHLFAAMEADIPQGQLLSDPEGAIVAYSQRAGAIQFGADDISIDPAKHLRHIEAIYQFAARAYGLNDARVSVSEDAGGAPVAEIRIKDRQAAAIRNEQIPFMADGEQRLAIVTSSLVRRNRARDWATVPPPDEVLERFDIEYPELQVIDDPKARREHFDWERKNGLKSRVDLVQLEHPEMSREEALDFIKRNVDEENDVNEILAERNQPVDGGDLGGPDIETPGEQNGSKGPLVRDAKRDADDPQ